MTEQIRLGDLLTKAGLLKPDDLREGMLIAKQQSLPVGRVLIMAEFISEPNLQAAVQAQSMIKDGLLDIDTAVGALKHTARLNISLEEALAKEGWKDKSNLQSNKLGGVLTEAGLINESQLDQGLTQAQMSGLPLGRVLVAMGILSEQLLAAALNAQILIRDSKIQRGLAIQGLRACHERQISIEQSLKDAGVLPTPAQDTIRLGELFVSANLLNQENLMQAVELGLTESKPIGQVLVEKKMISNHLLDCALTVQRAVAEGKVKKAQCGDVLAMMHYNSLSMDEAIRQLSPQKAPAPLGLPLYQFLQLAGLITAKDIEEALKQGSRDSELMGKMLLLTKAVDERTLSSSIRLNTMVTEGTLKTEQAILAMGLCQNRNCSVEQAFKSLGWSMHLDPAFNNQFDTIPPSMVPSNLNTSLQEGTGFLTNLDQKRASQHDQMQSGAYPAINRQMQSGTYPAVDQAQQMQSVAYQAINQQMQSGPHPAQVQPPQTDVPTLSTELALQQPVPEALEEKSEDDLDEDDDDTGSKQKGGGGGKKRLADLMP
ncbi:MAG: hypothetical protein K2X93_18980 [Candidatus Obscuribacterales bacterium]|nr:hypothetical protein [Candidatus Obscuribacterales bacterium]